MDIHKPKPVHSFREFLSEIFVVVCGVLIAIALEQGVEALHWAEKVRETEAAMRRELSLDDGAQAYARVAVERCLDEALSAIIAAAERGDGATALRLADVYQPPLRTWDRQSWEAAIGSDIASHIGAERLNLWSRTFDLNVMLTTQTQREQEGVDLMTGAAQKGGVLTPEAADRMVRAAKSLKRANAKTASVAFLMLKWEEPLDATPPEAVREKIISEARRAFGACVVVPNLSGRLQYVSQFEERPISR